LIFREVWEKAKTHEGYLRLKEAFQKEQKEWDKEQKKAKNEEEELGVKSEDEVEVKREEEDIVEKKPTRATRTKVKKEVKEEDVSD
jgi:hypothetical protein